MLTYCYGDIFTSLTQVMVNPVNCIGIRGNDCFRKLPPFSLDILVCFWYNYCIVK